MRSLRSWLHSILWLLWVGFVTTPESAALSPSPELLARLRGTQKLARHEQLVLKARLRGMDQLHPERLASPDKVAVRGNLKVLVLLVDFSDHPASGGGSFVDSSYFDEILFATHSPGRSMNDYYQEDSYGLVGISGISVNWLRMPRTYAYYVNGQSGLGDYPQNGQRMAEDAVDAAEAAGVDFSQFDNDGDGTLDGLFVVHSGTAWEYTGSDFDIHSHAFPLAHPRHYDGVTIADYTTEPEEDGAGQPVEMGIFAHEYGHVLGLPDLYDTDYTSSGIGMWCLMSFGNWANNGASPVHMSAWCKYQLGWIQPVNVTQNLIFQPIPQVETNPTAYRLWKDGAPGSQYFLIENRQQTKFDSYLPTSGLLIWHIDESRTSNDHEWYPGLSASQHYWVALEQADGLWDLERPYSWGDPGDPWPGSSGRTEFSNSTVPDSKAYGGVPTQTAVWNISTPGPLMTANLDIYYGQPFLRLENTLLTDNGNTNGRPDPGEDVQLVVYHRNLGAPAPDVSLLITSDDSNLVFYDSTSLVGAVGTGVLGSNSADPFAFSVPPVYNPRIVEFYVTLTTANGSFARTDTLRVSVGPDQVLLVDDDARLSPLRSYDTTLIMPVLDSLRIPYAHWEVKGQGVPTTLAHYPAVIWYTGDRRNDPVSGPDTTLTPAERSALAAYLDEGGHLWLTGQQIAHMLDVADSAFLHEYLHAAYGGPFNDFMAKGVDGDVVGDQSLYVLGGAGGAGNQLDKDLLIPANGGLPAFSEESNPASVTGVRYEGYYKVLFLGWGVEGIGDAVAFLFGAQPKSVLIRRALDWLVYDAAYDGVSLHPLVVNPGSDPLHLVDTAIQLHWNFVHPGLEPQDSIHVQVGSDPDWSLAEHWNLGPMAWPDTTVHYAGTPVDLGQTYFWRVRVFAAGTWTNWAYSSWHMNAAPGAPSPYSPVANEVAMQSSPVLITDNAPDPEGDACTYAFEVYADEQLTTLWAATTGVAQGNPRTSWTVTSPLPEHGRAWWRVRGFDGYFAGPWSAAESFYVDGINEAPSAPVLVAPADSAVLFSGEGSLNWNAAADPDLVDTLRYRVQTDTQVSLATATVYDSLAVLSLDVSPSLAAGKRYFWRVVAFDKGGLESPSATRTFLSVKMGDLNGNSECNAADIILLVNYVFKGGPPPSPAALGDVDASCTVTPADVIYMVNFVFLSGPAPLAGCAALRTAP